MSRRRVFATIILLLFPLGLIEARLFYLQVLKGDEFREQAETTVTSIEIIPTGRGRILDRNGVVLAQDERTFQIDLVLHQLRVPRLSPGEVRTLVRVTSDELERRPEISSVPTSMSRLARLFGVPRELLETALEYALVNRAVRAVATVTGKDASHLFGKVEVAYRRIARLTADKTKRDARRIAQIQREMPIRLINEVDYDVASEIRVNAEKYPGVVVTERLRRVYPQKGVGCHIVGYVSKMSESQYHDLEAQGYFSQGLVELIGEEEYARKERHGTFMADVVGKSGIELEYDEILKGARGAMILERDLFHRNRRILKHAPSTRGRDLRLTIDIELQRQVEAALQHADVKGRPGVAIVCDVASGEILALASVPTYDPNDLMAPVTPEAYREIFESPLRPLICRAVRGEYPLGSVFKVVTGLAALQKGAVGLHSPIDCSGKYKPDVKRFNCWIWNKYKGQHGPLILPEALQRSCNVFFYHAAARTGATDLVRETREFGFGLPTGIDLPGESQGSVPGMAGLATGRASGVTPNELLNLSIGQGRLMVTPLQVMRMMLAIANGGRLVDFRLNRDAPRSTRTLDVPSSHLQAIREGLYLVTHAKQGTAYKTGLWQFGAAGKTSTADVASAAAAAANPRLKPHAWFSGYAPHDRPRYAFVVVVENIGAGGEFAAPVAKRILTALGVPSAGGRGEPSRDSTPIDPGEDEVLPASDED